jgi:hypothetical protein
VWIAVLLCAAACGGDDTNDDESSGSSSGSCSDPIGDESCDGEPCGGDIVGKWDLVTFCAPACVSSVYETVSYGADGSYNNGQGTWEPKSDSSFQITVGNGSATHSFCQSGNRLWTQVYTNCGPDMSGPISITWRRSCEGGEDTDPRH